MDNHIGCATVNVYPISKGVSASALHFGVVDRLFAYPINGCAKISCFKAESVELSISPIENVISLECIKIEGGKASAYGIAHETEASSYRIGNELSLYAYQIGGSLDVKINRFEGAYVQAHRIGRPVKPYCSPICSIAKPYGWAWDNGYILAWDDGNVIYIG